MRAFFVPAAGVKVRDPKTMEHIPEEGAFVERNSYYIRRAKEGAGAFMDAPEKHQKAKKPVKAEAKLLEKETSAKK